MKKSLLIGCLILITACQTATQIPVVESTPTITLQTPTQTVAPTITLTATAAFTSTPLPLYFTEEFNSPDTSPWTSFQTGGEAIPTLGIENGLLRFDLSSSNSWYYAIHNAHEYEDASITAKFSGPPSGSTGVICRYSNSGWYEFTIASDGSYNVLFGQSLGDGIANYLPIASDYIEYLTPGTMDYEIGLTCQQDLLSLSVNGKLFRNLDVSRYALTHGKVGIATASFEEVPVIITFDWFKVTGTQ